MNRRRDPHAAPPRPRPGAPLALFVVSLFAAASRTRRGPRATGRLARLVLFFLAAVPAPGTRAAQEAGKVPRVAPSVGAERGTVLEYASAEGQPYWYRLPKKLDPKHPPDLIFFLHGTGMPWGWAFWNYGLGDGQLRGDDIVVAPEGVTPGQGDTFNFVQGKKDGDQNAGLIHLFRKEFPVDKVYVYGHSQGAFFAYWFAGDYTELVDGIVAHAGNVLAVNHNKLAKSKVGIGILHGRADAVVPVECAYETYEVYQEQGYEKVKLYVVDGLNEQTGHWPLPVQVAEMFEWLDQVSADSPGQALACAFSELGKEAPSLPVIAESAARAEVLLKKYSGEDEAALTGRLATLRAWLDGLEAAAAAAVTEALGTAKPEEFGPWMAEFRGWQEGFHASPGWQKAMKAQIALQERHAKVADKAAKALGPAATKKAVEDAMRAVAEAPLAAGLDQLVAQVTRALENPPKGLAEKDAAEFRALLATRGPADEQGRARVAERLRASAAELRAAHPELFAAE